MKKMFQNFKSYYSNHRNDLNFILTIISLIGVSKIINLFLPLYNSLESLISKNAVTIDVLVIVILIYIIVQLIIISNEDTIFEYSTKYPTIPKNTKSMATYIPEIWSKTDQYFTFLKNSKWIAHTYLISEEEAIEGGDYNFKRNFNFPISKEKIVSAEIFFVVDDFCTIILNNNKLCENKQGIDKLYKIDFKDSIICGENEIRFQIRNTDYFKSLFTKNPTHPFCLSTQKNKLNSYGLKYCISIKYRK